MATSAVASVCCLGPLLLLTLGVSGAWMSRLMIVESWYPLLASLSLALIALAAWQLMQARACENFKEARSLRLPEARQMAALVFAVLLSLLFLSSEYWLLWLV
ncbi:MAG: mercuric transporter MerT family protein [Pseudomonadales bacterium]|nr:mercuric transporter MerT family protein [Pseudomonadales bacterium]